MLGKVRVKLLDGHPAQTITTYIQYNEHLRIIHSIKDDMFQVQSIITACHSKKRVNDWFESKTTKEIIDEMGKSSTAENSALDKIYEKRDNLPINLRGFYIHRLLVNNVAMYASPRYSIYIMKLLDSHFERERQQLTETINEQRPRMVPSNKEYNYKYLIWKESNDAENTILHLVRRNKRTFRAVSTHNNDNERFYFKNDLPIAMTPNEDIKTKHESYQHVSVFVHICLSIEVETLFPSSLQVYLTMHHCKPFHQ